MLQLDKFCQNALLIFDVSVLSLYICIYDEFGIALYRSIKRSHGYVCSRFGDILHGQATYSSISSDTCTRRGIENIHQKSKTITVQEEIHIHHSAIFCLNFDYNVKVLKIE